MQWETSYNLGEGFATLFDVSYLNAIHAIGDVHPFTKVMLAHKTNSVRYLNDVTCPVAFPAQTPQTCQNQTETVLVILVW